MAEFVIGTGAQEDVQEVVKKVELQLQRTEGVPRLVRLRAEGIDVVAERDEFEGPWNKYHLRLSLSNGKTEAVRELAAAVPEAATIAGDDGTVEFTTPPSGQPFDERCVQMLKDVCQVVELPEVWRVDGDHYRIDPISPQLLFQAMVKYKASDVHLSPGATPVFRVDGDTRPSELLGPLSAVQIRTLIKLVAPAAYWEEFLKHKQTSFNYHQAGLGYSRVSAFIKSEAPHCTFRFLPEKIPSFEDLNVPQQQMMRLAELHRGLLLVTGMTGSGKTTTVAALLDWINAHRSAHILTIENPVEYVHANKKSIISQRTLGTDVESFNDAVTGALRHDPDVILIGEMRDPDTIRSAINAAATGHLVISTLHASTAAEVVNRVVSFFDPIERDLVKLQLRDCLKCVICQRLVPRIGGGRLPALEMMFNDVKAINDGILAGNTDVIRIGMQQTVSHSFLFEQYLHKMYTNKQITMERAREFCSDVSTFDQINMGTYTVPRLDTIKHSSAILSSH